MAALDDAFAAVEEAFARVLQILRREAARGGLHEAGLEGADEPARVEAVIQALGTRHARLGAALRQGDRSAARLASLDVKPSAQDLSHDGLSVRTGSQLDVAMTDLARAGLRLYELLKDRA